MTFETATIAFYLAVLLSFVDGVKLRSWLGSSMYVEGDTPVGRSVGQNVAELHGKIYVFGGTTGSSYLNDLHFFLPQRRTWTDLSSYVLGEQPSPRYAHALGAAQNKLFVFGGRSTTGAGPPFSTQWHC